MTNWELIDAAKKAATEHKTLYILGCFGAPMTEENKKRYTTNYAFNGKDYRKKKILAADRHTFGFDCVCFLKGLLWGWNGDCDQEYGGAEYRSNHVPDLNANAFMNICLSHSEDFTRIEPGEVVWIKGHIGLYIGDGLAVECTHRWDDGVQITAVHNIDEKEGYHGRIWTKHAYLPFIQYEEKYTMTLPVVRRGFRGSFVRTVQQLLIAKGCPCGEQKADGIFGDDTENAVRIFQFSSGIPVDGAVGEDTMRKLMEV